MEIAELFSLIFGGLLALGCMILVLTKNLFYAAITLMMTFLAVAAIYILYGAEFVAISQIVVYVGGVLVLLIFGILLTQRVQGYKVEVSSYRIIPGALISGAFFYLLVNVIHNLPSHSGTSTISGNTIEQIGINLVTENILVFEAVAILLLVALIGAATIAKPEQP
ncbi:MAG: NADH-quinone oxidoreductase subunit J [Cyclobacteriaceae bacterium]